MAHLGERLREQRLKSDVSLQHIAEETRIGIRYLEALEAGAFKQLPGAIFARSFVRQYAEIVGIDASTLEVELQQVFPSEEVLPGADRDAGTLKATLTSDTLLAANGPIWERLPLTAISLTAALVVSSLLYLGWQQLVLHNEIREPVAQQKAPPVRNNAPLSKPLHSDRPISEAPATVVPAGAASGAPKETAAAGTVLVPPAGLASVATMGVRLVANEQSWVSIAANGRVLFEGILQPREERTMNGVERARLLIGNAGGVDVLTDGRSIGPLGPQGSVRVVLLKPQGEPQILQNLETSPTVVVPSADAANPAVPKLDE